MGADERVFQNRARDLRFAGKRSLLSPPPPRSFHLFALAPFFARRGCEKRRSGTLATRASSLLTNRGIEWPH